jgi:glycosyltransferase involved in cell wall biosynthesis
MILPPDISVIIPTHNRSQALWRTITSLALQEYPATRFEVIVVADACSDNTLSMLSEMSTPFSLTALEQSGGGAAIARNFGAAHAKGKLLLFLDDDIETTPALLEAHARAHQLKPLQVVMGYLPPKFEGRLDFFRIGLRCWWEEQFFEMSCPGHRFTYRDLLSGNFSLEAELFRSLGGFDSSFRCREDYELGYRLIKSHAQFAYAPEAKGFHYDASTLSRACSRVFAEGAADVALGRRHVELRGPLLFFRLENFNSRIEKWFFRVAFDRPRVGDILADYLNRRLHLFEKTRNRSRWRKTFDLLRHYWYWRGVASELGNRTALATFLQSGPLHQQGRELKLNLREGLAKAASSLDSARPDALTLFYGTTFIGCVPPVPGAEPIRSPHLRPILAARFAQPLLASLALDTATDQETTALVEKTLIYADQSY